MKNSLALPIKLVLWFVPCVLAVAMLILKPHWGLMDDSYIVSVLIKQVHEHGIFTTAWDFAYADMTSWGMFRPLYPIMAYFVYLPGVMLNPTVTFLLNGFLSLWVLVYFCHVMAKVLELPRAYILLFLAAFFYQYDLFQHPSLQEKLVLLIGAAFIQLCAKQSPSNKIFYYFCLGLLLLLGVGSKASFMIFYSMGFWIFVSKRTALLFKEKKLSTWIETIFLATAGLIVLAFFSYVSMKGQYTKQFNVEKILPNLMSKEGVLFLFPIFLGIFDLIHKKMQARLRMQDALPLIGLLAFLAIFLPWGIKAYIQTIIGPVYATLWVIIMLGLFHKVPKALWLVPLMLAALTISSYRSFSMFVRLGDIGHIVKDLRANDLPNVKEIWVPCMEGADSFRRFVNENNNEHYIVHYWDKFEGYDGKVVFYDTAFCPLPNRILAPPGCTVENLITGRWSKSFRLSQFHCQDKT